jgi:hypothetical protein
VLESDPHPSATGRRQVDEDGYHIGWRRHRSNLIPKVPGRSTFWAIAQKQRHSLANRPILLCIVGQSADRAGRCQELCVEELISSLRKQQPRQPTLESSQHGTGTAVVHDEIN